MSLVYLIAGEASGDMLGAGLMRALKMQKSEIRFAGIGGDLMHSEGLHSLFPYSELSVMGFLEVLPHIPKFLRLLRETVNDIAAKKPDVIVTIDSPGFNFRLARMLQDNLQTKGIKRVHYVAPSVWAYKPGRARKTAQLFDLLLTLLPFEPPYFEKEGLKTVFIGHPVLWEEHNGDVALFRTRHGIAAGEKILLVLPGSRAGEVKRHLPIFLAAAEGIGGFRIVVLASPQVKEQIKAGLPQGVILCDIAEKQDAFDAATMALSKSGTITLELAAHNVPTVVAHKTSFLSAWLLRKMILIRYASLINIAVDKEILPELLQEKCTVENITQALNHLQKPEAMQQQREEIANAIKVLRGKNSTSPNAVAAKEILSIF